MSKEEFDRAVAKARGTIETFEVTAAPGCHGEPTAPVLRTFRSLGAAVRYARGSDRRQLGWKGHAIYTAPERGEGGRPGGRYGRGTQRGEPSLDECIEEAQRAYSTAWLAEEERMGRPVQRPGNFHCHGGRG